MGQMALVLSRFFLLSHSELESASLQQPQFSLSPSPTPRAWQIQPHMPSPGKATGPLCLDQPTDEAHCTSPASRP